MIIYDRFHIFPSKAILENIWVCCNIAFLKILGRQEGNYYFDTDWKFRNFHFGTEAQIEISTSEFDLPCLIIHLGRRNEAIYGESVISHLWWNGSHSGQCRLIWNSLKLDCIKHLVFASVIDSVQPLGPYFSHSPPGHDQKLKYRPR